MKMLTQSEIEAMAREAGAGSLFGGGQALMGESIAHFAALVAAKARAEAMEEAAMIVESKIDRAEAERAEKAARDAQGGDEDDEVRRLRHAVSVGLHNGALERAARAIRAAQKEAS